MLAFVQIMFREKNWRDKTKSRSKQRHMPRHHFAAINTTAILYPSNLPLLWALPASAASSVLALRPLTVQFPTAVSVSGSGGNMLFWLWLAAKCGCQRSRHTSADPLVVSAISAAGNYRRHCWALEQDVGSRGRSIRPHRRRQHVLFRCLRVFERSGGGGLFRRRWQGQRCGRMEAKLLSERRSPFVERFASQRRL